MKILIDHKHLDSTLRSKGEIELEGKIFAYGLNGDRNNPSYMIFAEEQGNWRESPNKRFKVPKEALEISHERGGAHGDLRLRYQNANIIFFPERDYWDHLRLDDLFLAHCQVIFAEQAKQFIRRADNTLYEIKQLTDEEKKYRNLFIKGNKNLLDKCGVRII